MKGKEKITGMKAPTDKVAKGSPQKAITGNTASKSSIEMMKGGQKGKVLKAKGK